MANSSDIGIIVRCGEVIAGLSRVDRSIDFCDLLGELSEISGLDLNLYSLKVSSNYTDNNMSHIVPIKNNRDLSFFFDPGAGFKAVELIVEGEQLVRPVDVGGMNSNDVPCGSTNDFEVNNSENHDLPTNHFGPSGSSNSETGENGFADDELSNRDAIVEQQLPRVASHSKLSKVPSLDSPYENVPIDLICTSCVPLLYDADVGVLKRGMIFRDKNHLQSAVKNYSVCHARREYKVVGSTSTTWKIMCKQNTTGIDFGPTPQHCQWWLRAKFNKKHSHWEITFLGRPHSCPANSNALHHKNLCRNHLASDLESVVQVNPAYSVVNVIEMARNKYDCEITYHKAWQALKRAKMNVYGTWESSCQKLPKLMGALQKYNPGTVVEWRHKDTGSNLGVQTLLYVFWAFRPCVEAFKHCRKVICVGGTHLYTKYKHRLLIAVALDADQNIIPLAYAIVDDENSISWRWFLQMLAKHVVLDVEELCLISNPHKDILEALQHVPAFCPPRGVHRFCLRHVTSDFNTHFQNVKLKELCYSAGASLSVRNFNLIMDEIKSLNHEAYQYLEAIDPCKWTFCYDKGRRYGVMTNNISEVTNGVFKGLRRFPITTIVNVTFTRSMYIFLNRRKKALHLQQKNQFFPDHIMQKFDKAHQLGMKHTVDQIDFSRQSASVVANVEGSMLNRVFTVTLATQECSCGEWRANDILCSHAMAACKHLGVDPRTYVPQCYSTSTFALTYSAGIFEPLADSEEWDEPSFKLIHNPDRRMSRRDQNQAQDIVEDSDKESGGDEMIEDDTVQD